MSANDRQAKILKFVDQAHDRLNQLTYYQLLGLAAEASANDVRKAYYKLAGSLHPDLHGQSLAAENRTRLTAVFSRVVEAYQVLTDHKRRAQYDQGLKDGKTRWDAGAAKVTKREAPEDAIKNPSARRLYKLARDAVRARNKSSAIMNLKMALSVEPGSESIKALLAEAEKL